MFSSLYYLTIKKGLVLSSNSYLSLMTRIKTDAPFNMNANRHYYLSLKTQQASLITFYTGHSPSISSLSIRRPYGSFVIGSDPVPQEDAYCLQWLLWPFL